MLSINDDDFEKIQAVQPIRQIDARILEKDILVTRAIIAMTAMNMKDMSLKFCGGTSLSKGYGLINRMGEDIDFKLFMNFDDPHLRREKSVAT